MFSRKKEIIRLQQEVKDLQEELRVECRQRNALQLDNNRLRGENDQLVEELVNLKWLLSNPPAYYPGDTVAGRYLVINIQPVIDQSYKRKMLIYTSVILLYQVMNRGRLPVNLQSLPVVKDKFWTYELFDQQLKQKRTVKEDELQNLAA